VETLFSSPRLAFAIRRILDHLGLNTSEAAKPLPLREVLRVAEHMEGWGDAAKRQGRLAAPWVSSR
jgi:hypothetical protein